MKTGRKSSVELLRIIACFFVIMAHIPLPVGETVGVISSRLVFSAVMADNVPLFLLAAGFFMFNGVSDDSIFSRYKYKIKSTLVNVFVPAVITVLFTCLLLPWLNGECSFFHSFCGLNSERLSYLKSFVLTFDAQGEVGHLWYVCTYVSAVFWFPLFAFVCQDTPERNKIRRVFEFAALLCAFFEDLAYLIGVKYIDISIFSVGSYYLYVLLGYELSLITKKYSGKKAVYISTAAYSAGLFAKYFLQRHMYILKGNDIDARFVWLQSLLCCVTGCALFALVCFIMKERTSKCINFLGKRTFFIYLVHRMIICKTHGIKLLIIDFNGGAENVINALLYYIEYGVLVFALSFAFGYAFELTYGFFVNKIKAVCGKIHIKTAHE